MYKTIMVPVDLAHAARLEKALATAADLCRHYGATAVYVGVTTSVPSSIARTPDAFAKKLDAFAADQAAKHGHTAEGHSVISHDPTIDLDPALLKAAEDIGADLIVMASHIPNITDYVWPSNGGEVASHAKASVMIVRG
jgi:nucleotide-binding universal stress UspA family protein